MDTGNSDLLIINAGSSSIKFAIYASKEHMSLHFSGGINGVRSDSATLSVMNFANNKKETIKAKASSFSEANAFLIDQLRNYIDLKTIKAVGHRIVQGMEHTEPAIVTNELMAQLEKFSEYDPDHLPAELELIKVFAKKFPGVLQVACFDTAFHATLPKVAKTFAIPKEYYEEGIKRYGFHGISYSYLMQELTTREKLLANGKIILAHLGSGASLAAVKDGKCVDTSMGFTPAAGIPMSTRSGDIDPGVAWFLMKKGLDEKAFNDLINHKSGLLSVSKISANMQDLLSKEKENEDASLAIDLFCYQTKKYIGGYAAAMGGLDVLVFSGGIGENAPIIRQRICESLEFLGIKLSDDSNDNNNWQISSKDSSVAVFVIPTNEELMIATETNKIYLEERSK